MRQSFKRLLLVATLLTFSCSGKEEGATPEVNEIERMDISEIITSAFGNGRIETEYPLIQLASPSTGILASILRNENDTVYKGEVIASLQKTSEEAEIKRILANIKQLRAQGLIDEEEIKEKESRTSKALKSYQRTIQLFDLGAETLEVLDEESLQYTVAKSNLAKAQKQKSVTETKFQGLHAQLTAAKAKLDEKNIKAPFNGKVLEWKITPGEGAQVTETVAQFLPEGKFIATCEIDELLADRLRLGQRAIVRNQAGDKVISEGEITFLSNFLKRKSIFGDTTSEAEDRRVRTVEIALEKQSGMLINSRVQCEIILD